jgi:hypothetical protein
MDGYYVPKLNPSYLPPTKKINCPQLLPARGPYPTHKKNKSSLPFLYKPARNSPTQSVNTLRDQSLMATNDLSLITYPPLGRDIHTVWLIQTITAMDTLRTPGHEWIHPKFPFMKRLLDLVVSIEPIAKVTPLFTPPIDAMRIHSCRFI